MNNLLLTKSIQVLLLLILVIAGLYYGRSFLIPIAFGGLLAMLLLPLGRWMESKGMSRGLAALLSVLGLVALLTGLIWLISWQVTDLTNDLGNMEKKVQQLISQVRRFISQHLGISGKQQDELLQSHSAGASEQPAGMFSGLAGSIMSMVVDVILVPVYIFLFIYFRRHLKKFVLMLVPSGQKQNAEAVMNNTQKVSQQYLTGLGAMIFCLWIMYSIGFSIAGVRNAIFFAILCGLLEIVPFAGNLTGTAITALMAFTQGGGISMVIAVVITYAIVQFIQTYILEPLVVGSEVNINPLFTIIVLVVGELLWGIAGMILAIPLTGILKIVFDHIEPLKPYGFLIGENKKKGDGLKGKIGRWFRQAFRSNCFF